MTAGWLWEYYHYNVYETPLIYKPIWSVVISLSALAIISFASLLPKYETSALVMMLVLATGVVLSYVMESRLEREMFDGWIESEEATYAAFREAWEEWTRLDPST